MSVRESSQRRQEGHEREGKGGFMGWLLLSKWHRIMNNSQIGEYFFKDRGRLNIAFKDAASFSWCKSLSGKGHDKTLNDQSMNLSRNERMYGIHCNYFYSYNIFSVPQQLIEIHCFFISVDKLRTFYFNDLRI